MALHIAGLFILPKCKAICRKGFVMTTKEKTMKVIAEGLRPESYCAVVDVIALQTAHGFELAAENIFENNEDEIIFDLVMRLFAKGEYMEAVDVLFISFSLIDAREISSLVSLIASTGREDVCREFMYKFVMHSDRVDVKKVDIVIDSELN